MIDDHIVEETRKIRDQIASQYHYDVQALGKYFQKRQATSNRKIVSKIRPEQEKADLKKNNP